MVTSNYLCGVKNQYEEEEEQDDELFEHHRIVVNGGQALVRIDK